jgi:DNA repair exonuclease SbcCD nuclease subunit
MESNLDRARALQRKHELLNTFRSMITYAASHNIDAIIIAGDLFDTKKISPTTQSEVLSDIESHPDITFYYLKGNHDHDNFLSGHEDIPENLKLFDHTWCYYALDDDICIAGVELSKDNSDTIYTSLVLDQNKFNIVILHGQESAANPKDRAEVIHLRSLRNHGIDYLALGHVHTCKTESLDGRGIYCYPGCLEGRGFDECGEHGFVELDIDPKTKKYTHTFVPFASRTLYTVEVDISGLNDTPAIEQAIRSTLIREGYSEHPKNLIKIVLTGAVDVACEKDIAYLRSVFEHNFYYVKIYDMTKLLVNYEDYTLDESLKGAFVRTVMKDSLLSEEDRNTIIRYGLQLIAGDKEVE